METIELALAADNGYFCGLFTTACSIAEFASHEFSLSFNILDGGIAVDNRQILEESIRKLHPHCTFRYFQIDDTTFSDFPSWHGSRMAYARILLPDLLPAKKWVVYCDVDFLWMRDISELWQERDESVAILSTPDGYEPTLREEESWFTKHDLPFSRATYFCSGLCVFNLDMFRKLGLSKRCIDILKMPGVMWVDQTALNAVTWDTRKLLPREIWQRFSFELTQSDLDHGVVIHYAGEVPWKSKRLTFFMRDAFMLWHQYNAKYRGITTWRSLRTHFSAFEIVIHRLPCLVARIPGVTAILDIASICILRHPLSNISLRRLRHSVSRNIPQR